jgi:hypothetical protein
LALAEYRHGQFDESIRSLDELDGDAVQAGIGGEFIRALAYDHLEKREEGRRCYEKAQQAMLEAMPARPDAPVNKSAANWIILNVLYQEAQAVFEPERTSESGHDVSPIKSGAEPAKSPIKSNDPTTAQERIEAAQGTP